MKFPLQMQKSAFVSFMPKFAQKLVLNASILLSSSKNPVVIPCKALEGTMGLEDLNT